MLNVLLLNSPKFWENLTNPLLAGIQAEVEEVCFDNLCLFVSMCYAKVKMKSKLTIWWKPGCRSRKQKREDKPTRSTFPRFVMGLV